MIRFAQIFDPDPQFPPRSHTHISDYISGITHTKSISLTPKERVELLSFEEKLTRSQDLNVDLLQLTEDTVVGLEGAWEKQVHVFEFFPGYFLTEEGRRNFSKLFTHVIIEKDTDVEEILYTVDTLSVDPDELHELSSASRIWEEERILREFEERQFQSIDGMHNPKRIRVVQNPGVLTQKVLEYAVYIKYLDVYAEELEVDGTKSVEARLLLMRLFVRRAEHLLAELYAQCVDVARQSKYNGDVTPFVEEVHQVFPLVGLSEDVLLENLSRVDKFVYGVAENGSVVSGDVQSLFENEVQEGSGGTYSQSVAEDILVDASLWQEFAKKALSAYDLLSSESESSYERGRGMRSGDGKWQVLVEGAASLKVDSKEGVLRVPEDMVRSLAGGAYPGAISILDHEIAHIIQHVNRARIPLAVCEKVGFARRTAMSEAGAVYWESVCSAEFFGKVRSTYPYYVRAIEEREKGGDYLSCMFAYFSSVVAYDADVSQVSAAKKAINRVMRIFRNGGDFSDTSGRVFSSKALVYSEQEIIAQKLSEEALARLLFVGGVNLYTLSVLARLGIFDIERVWVPEARPSEIVEEDVRKLIEEHTG